jgi:hypothetical protein
MESPLERWLERATGNRDDYNSGKEFDGFGSAKLLKRDCRSSCEMLWDYGAGQN